MYTPMDSLRNSVSAHPEVLGRTTTTPPCIVFNSWDMERRLAATVQRGNRLTSNESDTRRFPSREEVEFAPLTDHFSYAGLEMHDLPIELESLLLTQCRFELAGASTLAGAAVAGLARQAGRWIRRSAEKRRQRQDDRASQVIDNLPTRSRPQFDWRVDASTPPVAFCARCSAAAVSELQTPIDGGARMKAMIPQHCERCVTEDEYRLLLPNHQRVRQIDIWIAAGEFRKLTVSSRQVQDNPKRAAQGFLVNTMDRADSFSDRNVFLMDHLGLLNHMSTLRCEAHGTRFAIFRRRMCARLGVITLDPVNGTGTRNWATTFSLTASTAGGCVDNQADAEGLIEEHDGQVPQLVVTGCPTERFEELTGMPPRIDESLEAQADAGVEVEEKPDFLVPPDDLVVGAVYRPNAVRAGPMVAPATVWDRKCDSNKVGVVQGRSKPTEQYDKDSEPAKQLQGMYDDFIKRVATEERVVPILNKITDIKSLMMVKGKLNMEQCVELERYWMEATPQTHMSTLRKMTVKHEVIAKQKKYPRGVVDEGFYNLTINTLMAHVLDELIFGEDGEYEHLSIKHVDKREMIENFISDYIMLSGKQSTGKKNMGKLVGMEVDQTGMELHERVNQRGEGVMGGIMRIMQHVLGIISKFTVDGWSGLLSIKLSHEMATGMRIEIRVGGKTAILQFTDWYMTSGWRLTSTINFLNELFATLCACFNNARRLFLVDKTGKTLMSQRKHNMIFKTWWGESVLFIPKVEGDDLAAAAGAELAKHDTEIEANYKKMGYAAKLKFVVDGRLEFCGIHMEMKGGVPTGRWCPDFYRSLVKVGTACVTDTKNPHKGIASRFQSLAYMWAGHCEAMVELFWNLAKEHAALLDPEEQQMLTIDTHADLTFKNLLGPSDSRLIRTDFHGLSEKVYHAINSMVYPSLDEQAELLSTSMEKPVTVDELKKMHEAFSGVTIGLSGDLLRHDLPRCVQSKCDAAWNP